MQGGRVIGTDGVGHGQRSGGGCSAFETDFQTT